MSGCFDFLDKICSWISKIYFTICFSEVTAAPSAKVSDRPWSGLDSVQFWNTKSPPFTIKRQLFGVTERIRCCKRETEIKHSQDWHLLCFFFKYYLGSLSGGIFFVGSMHKTISLFWLYNQATVAYSFYWA